MAERLSGIGIGYPHERGEDWMVGRRMPDIVCDGKRVYELLREGKFVLVTAAPVTLDRPDVVHAVDAHPELPDAVLVRPDGYVAWASERHAGCGRTVSGDRPLEPLRFRSSAATRTPTPARC